MRKTILIIEDDTSLRQALTDTLLLADFAVDAAINATDALKLVSINNYDLIVSDVNLGQGINGLELLTKFTVNCPKTPVIIITAYGNINDAIRAIKCGAREYILKPFEPEILINAIEKNITAEHSSNQLSFSPIAESRLMKDVLAKALKVANTDASVLIYGESGTGKEVVAKFIHQNSNRVDKPFVAINCAAIPDNMLEAILFGYEKGSFTGALNSNPGKFEQAQGGTLLLDEISEMSLSLQAKLLRVIQEKEVERLGSKKLISLDVRIIATSNRNLIHEIETGNFREDLFYRLSVFPLFLSPLRDRVDDILPLAQMFLNDYFSKLSKPCPKFSKEARDKLLANPWKGNIRELFNQVNRAAILHVSGDCELVDGFEKHEVESLVDNLDESITRFSKLEMRGNGKVLNARSNLSESVKDYENQMTLDVLSKNNGNRIMAAKELGISGRTLRYRLAKMREQGIDVPAPYSNKGFKDE